MKKSLLFSLLLVAFAGCSKKDSSSTNGTVPAPATSLLVGHWESEAETLEIAGSFGNPPLITTEPVKTKLDVTASTMTFTRTTGIGTAPGPVTKTEVDKYLLNGEILVLNDDALNKSPTNNTHFYARSLQSGSFTYEKVWFQSGYPLNTTTVKFHR